MEEKEYRSDTTYRKRGTFYSVSAFYVGSSKTKCG